MGATIETVWISEGCLGDVHRLCKVLNQQALPQKGVLWEEQTLFSDSRSPPTHSANLPIYQFPSDFGYLLTPLTLSFPFCQMWTMKSLWGLFKILFIKQTVQYLPWWICFLFLLSNLSCREKGGMLSFLWVFKALFNSSKGRETGFPWLISHLVTEVPGNQWVSRVSPSLDWEP